MKDGRYTSKMMAVELTVDSQLDNGFWFSVDAIKILVRVLDVLRLRQWLIRCRFGNTGYKIRQYWL